MGKIIWSEKAALHLKAIHDYIAEDSLVYATNFSKSLVKATLKLEKFPLCGRVVPEFEGSTLNIREVIYKGYRILYTINLSQNIVILTIAHGRENIISKLNDNDDWIL